MNEQNSKKFLEELKKIKDLHPSSPEFAKLLSRYDLPFSTREVIKILKKNIIWQNGTQKKSVIVNLI